MLSGGVRRAVFALSALTLVFAADGFGQTPLTLAEAMRRGTTTTPAARALAATSDEAGERVRQARAGYLPRIDLTENVQRSNQPVFVFGALLSQQRFTVAHFAIDALNRPVPVTNVRTAVSVEQPVFDAGLTRLAVESAELGRDLAASNRMSAEQDLALGAARAFLRVLQFESAVRASQAAVDAAESDLERARARRDVGLVTDADVLDVDVHLADMRERHLATQLEMAVAGTQLNEAIGASLDQVHVLVPPTADVLIREAQALRSDRREADLRVLIAANARRSAQAAFLPRVGVHGGWEFNGRTLTDQRSSWLIGAQVQLNVFGGFGDAARVAAARSAEARTQAEREGVQRAIEVDVRTSLARLEAARGRQRLGEAAVAQARESQRIVRDRYDSGLATITEVLRAAGAVLDAEARAIAAGMDAIAQAVALDHAVGRL